MKTVGVLGAGQLGRMIALAGYPLGLRFRFLNPEPGTPAGQLAEERTGDYADAECLARFAEGLDVVTYEFENVPVDAVSKLSETVPVLPAANALEVSQDRLAEKTLFTELGIETPGYRPVSSREELEQVTTELGFPCVLKTRRMGYDGKGQRVLREPTDVDEAWNALGGTPLLLEAFIRFDREVSQIAVRSRDGQVAFYPLVENHHEHGNLHTTLAPAREVSADVRDMSIGWTQGVLEHLDYVGVLAIEFFQRGESLIANEMAPRVHNSGHWTIEGAATCQFENHLRAILGWPLGRTDLLAPCAMVNILGRIPPIEQLLSVPGAELHLYGKSPRPGRKLGHVTLRGRSMEELAEGLSHLRPILEPAL